MIGKLKNILISYNEPDFELTLEQLRDKLLEATRFGGFNEESKKNRQKILDIMRDVDKKTDKEVDDAVIKYTNEFDGVLLTPDRIRVSDDDLKKAHKDIDKDLLDSIRKVINNVRKYQKKIFIGSQKKCCIKEWLLRFFVPRYASTGVKYTPIRRVGICVPGASAPLPSTVIMTAVPAQVAGVKEIFVVSPPRHNGSIHPTTLAVCRELEITGVYRAGGVQAVTALAAKHGTIPLVDKIIGPGNQWVTTTKKNVSGDYAGIDLLAGPSEVLIIADKNAIPAWVAADMLSQAEHAPGSAVVLTDSQKLGEKILAELEKQLGQLTRAKETSQYLNEYSKIVVLETIDDCVDQANKFASEHLQIQCGDKSRKIADKIENAGAIFIGQFSPIAVGDYWAGPSHTLPTGGTARFSSALSSNDFVKATSIIEYNEKMLAQSSDDIIRLATAEGLDAHAKSVKIRQQ